MPGITGFTKNTNQNAENSLKASLALMTYYDWYVQDRLFIDDSIVCSRVHLGVIGDPNAPIIKDGIYAWVEGEFHNQKEVEKIFPLMKQTVYATETSSHTLPHAEFLINAYRYEVLENVLSKIDGHFCAVVYDSSKKRVLLISDRLGMKPIYYGTQNNVFSWNSELKGFLGFSHFDVKIQQKAIDCFLSLGYLIGDLTWFEGVKLIDAATIVTFDLNEKKIIEQKRYWTWAKIKKKKIDFEESVGLLSELIKKSVRKRQAKGQGETENRSHLGITLSGGLDSRAILMSCENQNKLGITTFGKKNCDDIRIAHMVTQKLGLDHSVLYLNEKNWFEKRLESVWRADGMVSLNHLHFGVHQEEIKTLFDINLNGFAGDLTLGGGFIKSPNNRIGKRVVERKFKNFAYLLSPKDPFFDIEKGDPFWIDVRVRRFTNTGSIEFSKLVEQRNPFLDNELLAFIYSLPDEFRQYSQLYNNALIKLSNRDGEKKIFGDIPWQKTGISPAQFKITNLSLKFKIPQIVNRLRLFPNLHFTDYRNWMRTEKSAVFFSDMLNPKKAVYPQFVNENFEKKYLNPHMKKQGNFVEMISRTVTLEYWLRKVLGY